MKAWTSKGLAAYGGTRESPGADATSRISPYLHFGCVSALELASRLWSRSHGEEYLRQLSWRDFYAQLLAWRPDVAHADLRRNSAPRWRNAPGDLEAWKRGRTGFPLVDAGMRQLLAEGWMHNRVRMVVASFLVKDLHVEWQHGARWFMRWLRDGDLASNQHNWQWVAGCGSDAAPYFRVFNPETQAAKFDPNGTYVRAYVRELRHLPGAAALTPWEADDGYARGYPERIVDHAEERREALSRLEELNR